MSKVYTLPRKEKPLDYFAKPITNCPTSSLYTIVKAGSCTWQVVSKSSHIIQYTASKVDWARDWIMTNDELAVPYSGKQEAA